MAFIINPITTCFVTAAEKATGEFDRFPFKYVLEPDGRIFYHTSLSAGRSVVSEQASIDGLNTLPKTAPTTKWQGGRQVTTYGTAAAPKTPSHVIQPLAHGQKIPMDFFYQIKQFFLDVMNVGPGSYEAQIFVIWNNGEYRLLVPKQTVSAAAVSYDIQAELQDGDVVIMDVHSHNTMGAFWSGTDDADDKKNCWISGVFGKITTMMEWKFRFNDGAGHHYDLTVDDIFEAAQTGYETPKEWLDQVQTRSYTYTPPKYSGHAGAAGKGNAGNAGRTNAWGGNSNARSPYGLEADYPDHLLGWDEWENSSVARNAAKSTSALGGTAVGNGNLFDDPTDPIYESIIDILMPLTNFEQNNVLGELRIGIGKSDHKPQLTERELEAYAEVIALSRRINIPDLLDVINEISQYN